MYNIIYKYNIILHMCDELSIVCVIVAISVMWVINLRWNIYSWY